MRKLNVFNMVSLDGFFTDAKNDMSWAHRHDPEWDAFVSDNASGGGTLLFGRVTYEQMKAFWPTPAAKQMMPAVAEGMTRMPKYVASRTMRSSDWANTHFLEGDLVAAVRRLKGDGTDGITIMGSGNVIAQLAAANLIDSYTLVVVPMVIGSGRTLFQGLERRISLRRTKSRTFQNGNVVLTYEPER